MRSLALTYAAVGVIGGGHSIRRGRPARFAGIRLPGSVTSHALTTGTPLSAPPVMVGALLVAAFEGRTDIVRALAATFVVGILGEPDTWTTIRRPGGDPLGAVCVVLDVALPAGMLWETR